MYLFLLLSSAVDQRERNPQTNSANWWLIPALSDPEHSEPGNNYKYNLFNY